MYRGFFTTFTYLDNTICPKCKSRLVGMNLTESEWNILNSISLDQDFVFALDKLKIDNPIEFTLKMSQFKQNAEASKQTEMIEKERQNSLSTLKASQSNIPKCPTCGSTNIKKISGTKRWITTGMFGLGSSNLGKTMQCGSCGYKW